MTLNENATSGLSANNVTSALLNAVNTSVDDAEIVLAQVLTVEANETVGTSEWNLKIDKVTNEVCNGTDVPVGVSCGVSG